jgi:copper chaperone CopZ
MVLQRIADVEVEADLDRKLLRVKYRGASPEQIKSALAEAGFTPEEAA